MKKFILSMFVIISFGTYVVLQSNGNSANNLLPLTTSNSLNNTSKNSNSLAIIPNNNTSSSNSNSSSNTTTKKGIYNDGQYTGDSVFVYDSDIQVKAIISGGKLTDIQFITFPQGGRSGRISQLVLPALRQEAIIAQSANINAVSGASAPYTTPAFIQSLASALNQAKA